MAQIMEYIPAGETNPEDIAEFFTETTDANDKTEALMSAMKDDDASFVTIHRLHGAGNLPEEFVTRFPADKFDFGQIQAFLADNYGGGDYRVRLYVKKKLRGNKMVSIAKKFEPEKHSVSPAGEAASILHTVLERQEKMHQQMMQLVSQQNQQPDRMQFFQEMMMMKELFSSGNGGSSGVNQLVESVNALKTLGIKVGTDESEKDDSEGGFVGLLEKMTPVITEAMRSNGQNQQPRQTQQRPVQQNAPQTEAEKMTAFANLKIKMAIGQFLRAAEKKSNPITYAELIFDMADEATIQKTITDDNAIEGLIKLEPKIALHRPWFDDLREHVKGQLGLPSRFAHLYQDDGDDINVVDDASETVDDDETNLHAASDS